MTIALVFKRVTWILRHQGLAITVCKAGLRIMSYDNLQQDENASQAGEEMSTADAVSLFTTSLNSALAKQKQDILSELQPNRQSSTSMCKESSINSSCQPNKFEFKQEGTKYNSILILRGLTAWRGFLRLFLNASLTIPEH